MGSSKIWRKGRWFWRCIEQNSGMSRADHWECGAQSKLTYTTKEEAERAGRRHVHGVVVYRVGGVYRI